MTEKIINGAGDLHSIVTSLMRTYPREKIKKSKFGELVIEYPRCDVVIRGYGREFEMNICDEINVYIEHKADILNILVKDGKRIPAEDVIINIPGAPAVTLRQFILDILTSLGLAVIKHYTGSHEV